jgi:hypothetical protein
MNVQWELGASRRPRLDLPRRPTASAVVGVGASAGTGWQRKYNVPRRPRESDVAESRHLEPELRLGGARLLRSASVPEPLARGRARWECVARWHREHILHAPRRDRALVHARRHVLSTGRGPPPSAPGSFRRRGGTRPGSGVRTHLRETSRGGAEPRGRRPRPKPGRRRRRRCLGPHGWRFASPSRGKPRLALGPRSAAAPACERATREVLLAHRTTGRASRSTTADR